MKKVLKVALRTIYLLPALGVLLSGNPFKNHTEPGVATLFTPEQAQADVPYSQGSYYGQGYYQAYYQGYYQGYYQDYYQGYYQDYYQGGYGDGSWPDCPAPGPGPGPGADCC